MPETEAPKSDPAVDAIKAAQAADEEECNNLAQQIKRSEQFAAELRGKLLQAQGKYARSTALLETLAPKASPDDAPP